MRMASRFAALIAFGLSCLPAPAFERIDVSVTPRRPHPGDSVVIRVRAPEASGRVQACLLRPLLGRTPLPLSRPTAGDGPFEASLTLDAGDPEGLYAIHVWTGDESAPAALGKGWFLHGCIIADYPILSLVDAGKPEADIRAYLEDLHSLGGNFLILHALIDSRQAFYPSRIARNDITPSSPGDLVESFLLQAEDLGFSCLLSVSWDMTHNTDYADAPAEIRAVSDELWALYGRHPSLAGFYSYQEGSGTYFVPYLRDFCGHIKDFHPNLITACAPYVDDPLLAGYLSMLNSLDMIIYQGMSMASYRPDNVKRYPPRRVRDFCGVGIGAKWLQDKIAITHTELFGYLENRVSKDHNTTSYKNILAQILSAGTVSGSDGIGFFTYHANVHALRAKHPQEIGRAREAVVDGLAGFNMIWKNVAREPGPMAFYYPYEDWVIERWATSYLPALDAFRTLGIPADFVPFAPEERESLYPFYPYKPNEEAISRLLRKRIVLVLPNVSGLHTTDSEFIKRFLKEGGGIVVFGPQLPMGNTFDRDLLLGAAEGGKRVRSGVIVKELVGRRVRAGKRLRLRARQPWTGWSPRGARILAEFEDGTAAVFINRVGKGVIAAFAVDAATAGRDLSGLVRDTLDTIFSNSDGRRAVDVLAASEDIDLASSFIPDGCRAAVVNHGDKPLDVVILPLFIEGGSRGLWIDLVSGLSRLGREPDGALAVSVPAGGYVCSEFRTR